MSDFTTILEEFKVKEQEGDPNVFMAFGNKQLCKVAIAFMNTNVTVDKNASYDNETDKWDWLWQRVKISPNEMMSLTQMDQGKVMQLLTQLKGLKLIYPDGTLNKTFLLVLKQHINKELKKLSGK